MFSLITSAEWPWECPLTRKIGLTVIVIDAVPSRLYFQMEMGRASPRAQEWSVAEGAFRTARMHMEFHFWVHFNPSLPDRALVYK